MHRVSAERHLPGAAGGTGVVSFSSFSRWACPPLVLELRDGTLSWSPKAIGGQARRLNEEGRLRPAGAAVFCWGVDRITAKPGKDPRES